MEKQLWPNRFAESGTGGRESCRCVGYSARTRPDEVEFHPEQQDTNAPGWLHLLEIIDEAVADGREKFRPLDELDAEERRQVITLPAAIGRLTKVKHLVLYGSNLVRIPPEIGGMTALAWFEPYTSHRLHWFPYELTRCANLRHSTVSTRALYGNYKFRPPFPALRPVTPATEPLGADHVTSCSVCDGPLTDGLRQVWLTRAVGSDVLPLLVNACSEACVEALPPGRANYVPTPHRGGPGVVQPTSGR
ncbi:leucine-rich repeat domain-containing protein [Paractinoplanes lichenicola]|uniref:Leucine-rich repeat domain-containing protein n=1 Tax=Paractinoplanes lichenicola TaxID=2802976 RepID=A0ABS1VWS6_9ACTN|nr:leucine-rich repeat domain-containing protein [Actinoplanes lichenicola]MBL7258894.1 leucine-rich repeat domain-containing protein [Actinoplanes lichenicola]